MNDFKSHFVFILLKYALDNNIVERKYIYKSTSLKEDSYCSRSARFIFKPLLRFYYNNEYDELVQFMLIYIPSHMNLVKRRHSLKISDLLSIIIGRYVRKWYRINKSIMPSFFLPAA